MESKAPIILGHRGASGMLPENTLAAFDLAIDQGAAGVELDVVPTRDGGLLVRHENNLSLTTDASTRLPGLVATRLVEGREEVGVFSEDLTVEQALALRARQRFDFRDLSHDGTLPLSTLQDVLDWRATRSRREGRELLVHVELKSPAYFRSIGLPVEPLLLRVLAGLDRADGPITIVSFDLDALRALKGQTRLPLVPILHPRAVAPDAAGLAEMARWAVGASFHKSVLLARPELIAQARTVGLAVMCWTFRREARFVEPAFAGDAAAEARHFIASGIDLMYSDWPGETLAEQADMRAGNGPRG